MKTAIQIFFKQTQRGTKRLALQLVLLCAAVAFLVVSLNLYQNSTSNLLSVENAYTTIATYLKVLYEKGYVDYFKNKGETKFTLTKTFKGTSYSMPMTNSRAGRQVYCVITDKYGNSVKTNTVTLNKK